MRLKSLSCLAAILVFFVSGHAQSFAEEYKCMVWRYKGEKATVYLAGSIHAVREVDYPLPAPYQEAYSEADRLVFEVDMGPALGREIVKHGTYPEGETVYDHIDEETKKLLNSLLSEVPENVKRRAPRSRPWLLSVMIPYWKLDELGVSKKHGIDPHFAGRAMNDRKPMEGLVSVQAHVASVATMPKETQTQLLKMTLEELPNMREEFEMLLGAWKVGDTATLNEIIEKYGKAVPGYREALLTKRNKSWMPKITEYLKGDEDVMVIVGAAHLVGHDSVVTLLEEQGVKGEQLTYSSKVEDGGKR